MVRERAVNCVNLPQLTHPISSVLRVASVRFLWIRLDAEVVSLLCAVLAT